jgi:Alternative complex III, ActD subunit
VSRRPYGLLAEFDTAAGIVRAAREVRAQGYRKLDAYTPYPMEELTDALDLHRTRVPLVVLGGGIFGLLFGWGLQYYTAVVDYPINIGGRPIYAWPAFVVPTFETTVLFSAFAALFGMLALNGLPQPYHPAFNVPSFARASRDRFFLAVEADDPRFDRERTRALLRSLGAVEVSEIEP